MSNIGKDIIIAQVKSPNGITVEVPKINGTGGDKTFIFRQRAPSSTWRIVHNLKKFPSVSIVDSGNNIVMGDVKYIDENTLTVSFTSGFSGTAYLN